MLQREATRGNDRISAARPGIRMQRSRGPNLWEGPLGRVDDTLGQRALDSGGGFLGAGGNYGQGSSREHAALCPMFLGIEGVFAQSFARIHKANLFNFGLIPLTIDADTYERLEQGDDLAIVDDVAAGVRSGQEEFAVDVNGGEWEFTAHLDASEREREILADRGKLSPPKKLAEAGHPGPTPAAAQPALS